MDESVAYRELIGSLFKEEPLDIHGTDVVMGALELEVTEVVNSMRHVSDVHWSRVKGVEETR